MHRALLLAAALIVGCGTKALPDGNGNASASDAGLPVAAAPDLPGVDAGTGADGGADAGDSDAGTADAGADAGTETGFLPIRHSPIADENALQGSRGWQLTNYSQNVAAYAGAQSVLPGEQFEVHAAANVATSASWELWRYGYYGGNLGRQVARGGPVALPAWGAAKLDPSTGAVSADWPVAFKVTVPGTATTGIYVLRIDSGVGQTYATIVVREPVKAATILYPVSTNTYQAYNDWGGTSLYVNRRTDWAASHAYAVSFDRPYTFGNGTGELFGKDSEFVTFAEGQGYDIAYVADVDLDRDPSLAERRRMIAFQGHSEYWTDGMRTAVETAIAKGTNVAFFAANDSYWQVRYADASGRLLVGYKEYASADPANATDRAHVTTRWRDDPVNRPENAMIGEMFGTWIWAASPLRVADPSSWLWTGAGVSQDSIIVGAFGDEVDRRFDNGTCSATVAAVADTLVEGYDGHFAPGETTLYTAGSGAKIFSAGSITWSRLVAKSGDWDRRVQQAVANLFSAFAGDGTLGSGALKPLDLGPGAAPPTYVSQAVTVSTVARGFTRPAGVAVAPNGNVLVLDDDQVVSVSAAGDITVVAGGAQAGSSDGPALRARFRDPRGIAVAANGDIYVSDTGNHRIRLISQGNVTTLAGSQQGFRDGPGAQALFSQPMGIALSAAGTLYVADSWNHRIRAVSPTGDVTTYAGSGVEDIVDGTGATAAIQFPIAIAVLPGGDLAVPEAGTGVIRRISAAATHDATVLAGLVGVDGWGDGPLSDAKVSETLAVATRPSGELAFVDGATARVRMLSGGAVATVAGGRHGGTVDGAGDEAGFGWLRAIAAAPDGSLYVVDARERTLRHVVFAK